MGSSLFIILDFAFRLAILLFLARFLLQACKADFYNPISQAVVKATDTVCKPLRTIVPSFGVFDIASLLMAWLVAMLSIAAVSALFQPEMPSVATFLLGGIIKTLLVLIQFYKWNIIIIVIASFIAAGTTHPALQLLQQLVEPLMAPVRKILPSLGPLDLSPMVVILLIIVVEDFLLRSFR